MPECQCCKTANIKVGMKERWREYITVVLGVIYCGEFTLEHSGPLMASATMPATTSSPTVIEGKYGYC